MSQPSADPTTDFGYERVRREVAERAGCKVSLLVQRAADIDWNALAGITRIGLSAGASAPEVLVEEIIEAFRARYDVSVETVTTAQESVHFPPPRELRVKT